MDTLTLSERLTDTYRDGWDYLDTWQEIGTATLTPARRIEHGDGHGYAGAWVRHARLPAGQDLAASRRALENTLSASRCRCEHDCCVWCLSLIAETLTLSRRRVLVRIRGHYNV